MQIITSSPAECAVFGNFVNYDFCFYVDARRHLSRLELQVVRAMPALDANSGSYVDAMNFRCKRSPACADLVNSLNLLHISLETVAFMSIFRLRLIRSLLLVFVAVIGAGLLALIFVGGPLQSYLILPALFIPKSEPVIPADINQVFLPVKGGQTINLWSLKPIQNRPAERQAAIVFHGNKDTLQRTFGLQRRLAEDGFHAVGIDYRGTGQSGGHPSEQALFDDAEASWSYLSEQLHFSADEIVVVGFSLGAGPASYLASKHEPRALVLLAPYTSIGDVMSDRGALKYLKPLLRYNFPVKQFLSELQNTCVIAAHGGQDEVIRVHHVNDLEKLRGNRGTFVKLIFPEADHSNLIDAAWPSIKRELAACMGRELD